MQRPKFYHKDFNLGLTDREIRSFVTSIIPRSVCLYAPESCAAEGQAPGRGDAAGRTAASSLSPEAFSSEAAC